MFRPVGAHPALSNIPFGLIFPVQVKLDTPSSKVHQPSFVDSFRRRGGLIDRPPLKICRDKAQLMGMGRLSSEFLLSSNPTWQAVEPVVCSRADWLKLLKEQLQAAGHRGKLPTEDAITQARVRDEGQLFMAVQTVQESDLDNDVERLQQGQAEGLDEKRLFTQVVAPALKAQGPVPLLQVSLEQGI